MCVCSEGKRASAIARDATRRDGTGRDYVMGPPPKSQTRQRRRKSHRDTRVCRHDQFVTDDVGIQAAVDDGLATRDRAGARERSRGGDAEHTPSWNHQLVRHDRPCQLEAFVFVRDLDNRAAHAHPRRKGHRSRRRRRIPSPLVPPSSVLPRGFAPHQISTAATTTSPDPARASPWPRPRPARQRGYRRVLVRHDRRQRQCDNAKH